jgi:hypothetical protein
MVHVCNVSQWCSYRMDCVSEGAPDAPEVTELASLSDMAACV